MNITRFSNMGTATNYSNKTKQTTLKMASLNKDTVSFSGLFGKKPPMTPEQVVEKATKDLLSCKLDGEGFMCDIEENITYTKEIAKKVISLLEQTQNKLKEKQQSSKLDRQESTLAYYAKDLAKSLKDKYLN